MRTTPVRQTLALTAALMWTVMIGGSVPLAQAQDDGTVGGLTLQSKTVEEDRQPSLLVGVWEESGPAEVDCQTRQPSGPMIKALLTFNAGGTMYVEDTFPFTGPYRTTGGGVWAHVAGRSYAYGNVHYEFDPDKTFTLSIKQRSDLTLSRDGNSFIENGTFQGIDPSGVVIFGGCFAATATRVVF